MITSRPLPKYKCKTCGKVHQERLENQKRICPIWSYMAAGDEILLVNSYLDEICQENRRTGAWLILGLTYKPNRSLTKNVCVCCGRPFESFGPVAECRFCTEEKITV